MRGKDKVPVFIAETGAVEQPKAFAYWRDTVMSAADITPFDSVVPFSASRMVAASAHGTLLRTVSGPIGVDRDMRHIRRDGRDEMSIMLIVAGEGYVEQGDHGTLLRAGDVAFHAMGQPGAAGSRKGYEEIRLVVPRATFLAQVGNTQDVVGRKLGATPARGLLSAYLAAFTTSVSGMSEGEAGIAVEGVLHLLRGVIHGRTEPADGELSAEAMRSLALAHIQRRLHEPEFGPNSLAASLRVSRSRLYAAFAGGQGIAATIRDARLDRAHDRIVMMRNTGARIASIMTSCGFTDPAAFSRAFRQRFGLSPRDLVAQGAG
ncbi:helix-turn-helix domain-containing protein [Methylobacterium sp. E-066]|uniref:helix-turn-helix domain-containing protein n=1 Tax=Methylobacterium sp. E-066 TaxID=2836584 RepID=UPI001FB9970D|nr:helix-turn-helix domain-containing protein [Methylobacterium sp. E-066]MCJ2143181.1 helix-turn-helix domain-containing protein [Methylobacterium sp. E-066]